MLLPFDMFESKGRFEGQNEGGWGSINALLSAAALSCFFAFRLSLARRF